MLVGYPLVPIPVDQEPTVKAIHDQSNNRRRDGPAKYTTNIYPTSFEKDKPMCYIYICAPYILTNILQNYKVKIKKS